MWIGILVVYFIYLIYKSLKGELNLGMALKFKCDPKTHDSFGRNIKGNFDIEP